MTFLCLIYFIMSNAVANSKKSAILYSRSTFIIYFFSMLFIYSTIDWYFYEKSISLFNGLIYCNINNLVFIFFIFLLSFCIIILTSFYPVNLNASINTNASASGEGENFTLHSDSEHVTDISKSTFKHESQHNNIKNMFNLKELFQIERDHYKIIEYPLITQFIVIGGISLLSSNDLITIFLSVEKIFTE